MLGVGIFVGGGSVYGVVISNLLTTIPLVNVTRRIYNGGP